MSCDCVDTLLRSLFLCVCLGVAQTIREATGVSVCVGERGGHVRTDPRVQGDQQESSEARAVDKEDILLRCVSQGAGLPASLANHPGVEKKTKQ